MKLHDKLPNGEQTFIVTDSELTSLYRELRKIVGAVDYSGDCSTQILLPTTEGKYFRVGSTDDDVAEEPFVGLWWDYYEGLRLEGCPQGEVAKLAEIKLKG